MVDNTGVIREGDEVKGQIQLITVGENRRVQLYTRNGYFLCEAPFTGDDDRGYEQGQTLYMGYIAGWKNANMMISQSVDTALREKKLLEL